MTRGLISDKIGKVFEDRSGCGSVWLERYIRDVEAACSNHVTPRMAEILNCSWFPLFRILFIYLRREEFCGCIIQASVF